LPGKPGPGGIGGIDRPTTLPGRPGIGGDGNIGLPGKPDRPQIGGGGNWNGNRPGYPGSGNNRPGTDRPWIGGGNNNNIGNNITNNNNNFINNNNNININNWNRPGWGVGGGNWNNGWNNNHWNDHWHNNYVNNHYHGWYHGCWNGHYGNYWYAPWVVGVSAWGLGSLAGWGYGTSYYNPYYIAAATPVYNYSQPVVVQNYYTTDDTGAQVAAAPQATAAQLQPFDDGLAKFKAGDYLSALQKFDQALREFPKDAVVHEVRALTLFALGRYQEAGAALNALLATSPGMDWTTMSGLYGDPAAYTTQLRKLEDYCRANKDDAAALFALTYQYLVIGQQESAVTVLKHIVKMQPKDVVSARMLKSLEPDQPAADPAVVAKPAVQDPAANVQPANNPAAPANAPAAPQTDLVGSWKATAGKTTIELTITEDSQYTWAATTADQKPVKLEGQLTTSPEAMILSNAQQGDMMGKVKSLGPDKFDFTVAGTPPGEPGLSFSRLK
jgi:tetratricopeptide (TPR) repeat protein